MASFTKNIKDEITKIETNKLESIAEVNGFLMLSGIFFDNKLNIYVENNSVARRIFSLLKRIYNINIRITIRTQKRFKTKTIYILEISDKLDFILKDIEDMKKNILDYSDEERASFLKGCFLANGSINDPSKSKYHLEIFAKDEETGKLINNLFHSFDLSSKIIKRQKEYMIYVKAAEEISDFIKMLGAIESLFYYEDIRIYRDHKNMVNRLNNCEQANVEKSYASCQEQLENIKYLEEHDLMDLLDEKVRLVIDYRIKYPETTLQELADIISMETDYNLTKSGINHHFRKIKDLVNKDKNKEV
ncbi:MAG: DNA-binding protein WhiA [Bacilli bacterium]|nr:DNA-binding protein WhiA [Bacilli bacterium]